MLDAKEYLNNIIRLQNLIDSKKSLLTELQAKASYQSPSFGERVDTSIDPTSMESKLLRVSEVEHELMSAINDYSTKVNEAIALIDKITNSQSVKILYLRYLENKTWEKIAVELNHDLRYTYKLHGEALVDFSRVLNAKYDIPF